MHGTGSGPSVKCRERSGRESEGLAKRLEAVAVACKCGYGVRLEQRIQGLGRRLSPWKRGTGPPSNASLPSRSFPCQLTPLTTSAAARPTTLRRGCRARAGGRGYGIASHLDILCTMASLVDVRRCAGLWPILGLQDFFTIPPDLPERLRPPQHWTWGCWIPQTLSDTLA